jgi:hypothetical protein
MADTFTTNLNLTKPEVGASTDTWGTKINADLDALDAIFAVAGTAVNVKFASANFDDNAKAIFGTGDDLEIYHSGSHSIIKDGGTGNLLIQGDSVKIMNAAGDETFIDMPTDSHVALNYNNATKFQTSNTGATVTGTLVATLATAAQPNITSVGTLTGFTSTGIDDNANATAITIDSSENLIMTAGGAIRAGGANDLILDAGESGTPDIYLQSGGATRVKIEGSNGSVGIGTNSPQKTLDVRGTFAISNSTTSYWNFDRDDSDGSLKIADTNTERMRIDASGNVTHTFSGGETLAIARDGAGTFVGNTSNHNLRFITNDAERMRIDTSGNLLIGHTSQDVPVDNGGAGVTLRPAGIMLIGGTGTSIFANREDSDGTVIQFRKDGSNKGTISITSSAVAYNTSSDARLKEVTGKARGLEVINALNPVAYNWKEDGKSDEGLIAQEVEKIVPNAVSQNDDEYYEMDYSKLVTPLVKAIQEQQTQINALQSEINTLKGE